MKFKIWSEKMNIEYMLMQCCIVEKNEKNGSLQHNNI